MVMEPSVLINQAKDLAKVQREQLSEFKQIITDAISPEEIRSVKRVIIFGDGDSYHAARAMEMAFENIANITCEPMSSQRFLNYNVEWMRVKEQNDTLVIGISASGKTQRVVQGLERANEHRGFTLALTGTPDSPVTTVAQRSVCVEVPNMGPSPGIRTYNASLMGLGLLALRIGEISENLDQAETGELYKQLADLADALEQTANAAEKNTQETANALSDAQKMMFLGSGPSYGTALFSAAKIVEAAGVFAIGQDLEEWAHVERFAYPIDMPVFIIAPPGKSHWRAANLASAAQHYGRRVIAIIKDGDNEIAQNSDFIFPIFGEMREEFSPLVYHTAVNFFATYLTTNLDRKPFQGDKPEIRQKYEEINAFQL